MVAKGKIPFVRLLVPLICGITFGSVSGFLLQSPHYIPVIVLLLGMTGFVIVFYKEANIHRKRWLSGVVIHLLIFAAGYYSAVIQSGPGACRYAAMEGDGLILAVNKEPVFTGGILRFEGGVKYLVDNRKVKQSTGKLLVAIKSDTSTLLNIRYGDLILIPYKFSEVDPPYNPGEFDYKKYLARQQLYHQTFIDADDVKLLERNQGNPVIAYAINLRQRLVHRFNRYVQNPDAAVIASTLILGYRADLNKDIITSYSKTGTMHVLSVSGMHVGIVFLLLSGIIGLFQKQKKLPFLKPLLIVPAIWSYAVITSFSPSVCRASLMLTIFVIGKSLNRSHNPYNLVAISAFLLLLYNPYYIFDVGFQLSYLAVIGLVVVHPLIYQSIDVRNPVMDQIWNYAALSIAAQLATFPLSIYYFHQFPVYFLVSNLFIVIPVTLVMYVGFLFIIAPVNQVSEICGWLLGKIINGVNDGLRYIENLPFSSIGDVWLNSFEYVMIYVIIILSIGAVAYQNKRMFIAAIFSVLILSASVSLSRINSKDLHQLIFFSLRKGSAVGYLKGEEAVVVTTLSPSDPTVLYAIEPALSSKGITRNRYERSDSAVGLTYRDFYKFSNYTILKWSKQLDFKDFHDPVSVDAVWLTGNASVKIAELNKQVRYSILLIDGSNADRRVAQWKTDALKLGVKCYILKRNPAFVMDL